MADLDRSRIAKYVADLDRSRIAKYVALAAVIFVVVAVLFPTVDGLNVTGFFGDKTYLIVLQDNAEIRGTGGLISSMGLVTMHDGSIASLQYYYRNGTVLQTLVALDGPASFTNFLGVNSAALHDSNVQYDFASFAPKVESDFYNVTGHKVDGVIGVDFTAVQAVMNITGPITVSGQVITSRNVADLLHYYSGTAAASTGQAMTGLLSTLTYDVARSVLDSSIPQKLALYTTLQTLENEGHVLIYPNQGFWFRSAVYGAVGEMTPPTTDSIAVVDNTLGTGKADFGVTRTIDDHVEILSDGSAISTLTLTYTNGCWWKYDVVSTALIPAGAQLVAVQNATEAFRGPLVTNGDGFTALTSRLLVSANGTGSVTYTYTQPNVVSGNALWHGYDLYIQKQAGITSYIVNASVQLPPGATMITAENVGSNQVFSGDAYVSVVYT